LEQFYVLLLKGHAAGMFLLLSNVFRHALKVPVANREGAISFLPSEQSFSNLLMDPFGRVNLYVTQEIINSM
jgi:hypothetical protein